MSAGKFPQVWECETFERIARAAFPASTEFYLSRATGISRRTVEKHLRGEAKPSADHCLAYLAAGHFGQRLAAAFLPAAAGDQLADRGQGSDESRGTEPLTEILRARHAG
ncbi:hypothetical protein [Pararhizobium sp.]|uniref:hypothetical protein n=1 Tax=Pararhizobium sp. TaxID=1977563 RepID=UPI003D10AA8B